jgi:hypothetical protein
MKITLIILLCFLLFQTCFKKAAKNIVSNNTYVQQPGEKINFEKEVMPILVKNCSPCHFTGGKMYDQLPFDRDTTLLNHQAGILRRIKNEGENALLKKFVAQYRHAVQ